MSRFARGRCRELFRACARVEPLERRRLLASASLQGNVLVIEGNDPANDAISVTPSSGGTVTVKVNNTIDFAFNLISFDRMLISGFGGNDNVTIDAAVTKPASILGGAGNDSLIGGSGNDTLDGGTGGDTLKGGGGNDTADYSSRTEDLHIGLGTLSDDGAAGEKDNVWNDIETVFAGSGDDTLKGSAGNNRLVGNGGDDSLLGNYGNDTLIGGPGTDVLNGEAGTDTGVDVAGDTLISIEHTGGGGGTVAVTPDRTLIVTGTSASDVVSVNVVSTDGGDTFEYRVTINGVQSIVPVAAFDRAVYNLLGGNDTFELSASFIAGEPFIPATVNGGDGNDVIRCNAGAGAFVNGGGGNDSVEVDDNGGVQIFDGGPGVDSFRLDNPDVTFLDMAISMPTVENAQIYWGTLLGNALNNELRNVSGGTLNGRGGNDTLIAGGGDASLLLGGDGNDSLVGNDFGDTLSGGAGGDTMKGGDGNDTLDYSSRSANLTIGPGTLSDDGEAGEKDNIATDIETILGGAGDDHIKGTAAANLLVGNGGNDTLLGFDGDDTLDGGVGPDSLDGGPGTDTGMNATGDTLVSIEFSFADPPGSGGTAVITAERTLLVTGTEGPDIINLHVDGDLPETHIAVRINEGIFSFLRSDFDRVRINALGHTDSIFIDEPDLDQPVTIDGGGGHDDMTLRRANAMVIGGAGDDLLRREDFPFGALNFDGGSGVDFVLEDDFDPVFLDLRTMPTVENARIKVGNLLGNELPNELTVEASAFDMQGFGGNDTLFVGGDADYGESSVDGGAGDDVIEVDSNGGNLVQGGEGNDTLRGGGASSEDTGIDEFIGGGGDDLIDSSSLEAALAGGDGNDTLLGSGGADVLFGGEGNDLLDGRDGDDTVIGEGGADTLRGGDGNDTADYSGRAGDLTIGIGTLSDDGEAGEGDNAWLDIETVLGGDGDDFIRGYAGDNRLVGGFGSDTLLGHYGDDTLVGGPGSDVLNGEVGNDTAMESEGDELISIETVS